MATVPSRTAPTRRASAQTERRGHGVDAGARVTFEVGHRVGDRQGRPRQHRHRDEDGERGRDGAGRPNPGEDRQERNPDRVGHPRPARPLEAKVIDEARREAGRRHREGGRAGDRRQHEPGECRHASHEHGGRPGNQARRNRLAGLRRHVGRGIRPVVDRPDGELQAEHGDPQEKDPGGLGPGDGRDDGGHDRVEEGWKRMDQPDEAGEARCRRDDVASPVPRVAVRRRRAPRSSPRGTRRRSPGSPGRSRAGPSPGSGA